jgi:hypothetical protein
LVAAKSLIISDSGVHTTIDVLMKIDTISGETWRYDVVVTPTGPVERWIPVHATAPDVGTNYIYSVTIRGANP